MLINSGNPRHLPTSLPATAFYASPLLVTPTLGPVAYPTIRCLRSSLEEVRGVPTLRASPQALPVTRFTESINLLIGSR